jgi:hypothetical protein
MTALSVNSATCLYLIQQSLYEEDQRCRANFNWNRRDPVGNMQSNRYTHLWPRSGIIGGDAGTTPYGLLGDDYGSGPNQSFEPNGAGAGYGTQTVKFINGSTVDSADAAVANAEVQAFRTSDDVYMGSAFSKLDGSYQVGLNQNGGTTANCYLVAYKAGSPDIAGTTVNTLTPTNIDGT